MGIFDSVTTLIKNESRTIRNIITLLLTFSLEKITGAMEAFKCPEKRHQLYGWVFIFVPAIVIAVISVMLSSDFWKITRGICYHKAEVNKRRKFPWFKPIWSCFNKKVGVVFYNVLAASSLWLFWAFLDGRYYMCAKEGNQQYQLKNYENNSTATDRIKKNFEQVKSESQLIALLIIVVVVIVPSFIIAIYRCCYEASELAIPDPDEFKDIEAAAAVVAYKAEFKELAKKKGEKTGKQFFQEQKQAPKNPAEVMEGIHKDLKERYGLTDTYEDLAAVQYKTAFVEKLKTTAKDDIKSRTEGPVQDGCGEGCDSLVKSAHGNMVETYPRSIGYHSQPHNVKAAKKETTKL